MSARNSGRGGWIRTRVGFRVGNGCEEGAALSNKEGLDKGVSGGSSALEFIVGIPLFGYEWCSG